MENEQSMEVQFRLIDERRVLINALRDVNQLLQKGNSRQAQRVIALAALSIPEIGGKHG
jgi:hypothetical protein